MLYSYAREFPPIRLAPAVSRDAHLLAAARELDSRALAEIYDRYFPDVYRYALYRTNDEHVAEDLSSEVFTRLLDALHKRRPPKELRPWLFGVANNLVAMHFRTAGRRPETELPENLSAPESDDPLLTADRGFEIAAVRRALPALTPEQLEVLALRFGEGRTLAETAEEMQKTVDAVKQLQRRAVTALRRKMEGTA